MSHNGLRRISEEFIMIKEGYYTDPRRILEGLYKDLLRIS
jgi:hypothetical protein